MLTLPLQKLAFLIEKFREYEAEVPADSDASDSTDDRESGILLDTPDNSTGQELRDAIDGLNQDEQEELLALMWVGRGDFEAAEWPRALAQARETRDSREADYLLGTPLMADYLDAAADTLGLDLEEFEINRL